MHPIEHDKLKAMTDLASIIFQRVGLKIMPTFFICSEDTGYGNHGYVISWENEQYVAEIAYCKSDKHKDFRYWLVILEIDSKKALIMDTHIKRKDLSAKNPKIVKFIKFVNRKFKRSN